MQSLLLWILNTHCVVFQWPTSVDQTNPNLAGKNHHHFIIAHNFFFLKFIWFLFFPLVDLQGSVNFYWTAKWPSHTYIDIDIDSFSHIILLHVPSQVTRYSCLCYTAGSHISHNFFTQKFGSLAEWFFCSTWIAEVTWWYSSNRRTLDRTKMVSLTHLAAQKRCGKAQLGLWARVPTRALPSMAVSE